jgi:NADH dehydrogenase
MILVVGASGLLGGTITRRLLEQGKAVRILQRSNPAYQAWIEAGAEGKRGDLKDRASLDRVCTGIDIVITTANATLRGGDDTLESVDRRGTMNLIDAARMAGVKQFIYVSAYGSDPTSPVPLLRYKAECEQYLRASGLTYTILRPHIFIEVWVGAVVGIPLKAGQPVTLVEGGSHRHSFISVNDVAAVAVAVVGHAGAHHEEIAIGGSPAVSWTQIAEIVGRTTGNLLSVRYVRLGEPVPLLPDAMAQLLYSTETYETDIDMAEVSRTYGIKPTPLEESIRYLFSGVNS